MMGKKLYVLLTDVISSRTIQDSKYFQSKINSVTQEINSIYSKSLYSRFKGIKGVDEFGCILRNIAPLYKIVKTISDHISPVSMRFAVVYEQVNELDISSDITKMTGPAFHMAYESINQLKKKNTVFRLQGKDMLLDTAISSQMNLLYVIKQGYSLRQRQIIRNYEIFKNQKSAAEKLRISQQTVSKALVTTRWSLINGIEEQLNDILYKYD